MFRRKRRAILIVVAVLSALALLYHVTLLGTNETTDSRGSPSMHDHEGVEEGLQNFRKLLSEYTSLHKPWSQSIKADVANDKPVLFYSCAEADCGNLGDHVNAMVTAFILAVYSDRAFVVDVSVSKITTYLQPYKIDWSVNTSPSKVEVFDLTLTNAKLHSESGKAIDAILSPRRQYVSLTSTLKPEDLFSPYFDQEALQRLCLRKGDQRAMETLRDLLWEHRWLVVSAAVDYLFTFSAQVIARAAEIQKTSNLFGLYSAVHIHTGLGLREDDIVYHRLERLGMSSEDMWSFMIRCSATISDKKLGHPLTLYVASDHAKVKEWLGLQGIDHVVFYDVSLSTDFDDREGALKDVAAVAAATTSEVSREKVLIDTWAEIFILSKAKVLLLSPLSKYSDLAVVFRSTHVGNEYVYTFPYHEECSNS